MNIKPEPKLWAIVTVIVAIIGCLGVLGAALISVLPNILKPEQAISTPVVIIQNVATPIANTTNSIAGNWTGTFKGISENFSAEIILFIQKDCAINNVCGTYSVPSLPCSGNLILTRIDSTTFVFVEQKTNGADWCGTGGYEYLQLLPDNTLSWGYSDPGKSIKSTGILKR